MADFDLISCNFDNITLDDDDDDDEDDDDDDDDDKLILAKLLTDKRRLRLISSRHHCSRFSLSEISDKWQTWFEPAQNPSSDFVE